MSRKLNEKQEQMKQAAIEFASGVSMEEVLEKYSVCYASVYNAIKRYDIPFKKTYGRQVFFDEDFFENIDSEEKAYWLGFIMADGCVAHTTTNKEVYNRVYLNVTEEDKDHLLKFKKTINHTGNFIIQIHEKSYSPTPLYYLHCNSTKMCNDLIKIGCNPRKTGNSCLPEIPENLMRHFIRGYFDGDGAISIYSQMDKRNPLKPVARVKQELSFTSDRNMLLQIQNVLVKECNVPHTKLKEYKRTTKAVTLRYGGKQQVKRIYEYLYTDATVFLERKYNKFSLLFS